ncbi:hypothetical protein J1614_010070 [Plenodomus biglobosus]|nr:hypothetical protein J1614_010070 [Plenodomus biglobosus]
MKIASLALSSAAATLAAAQFDEPYYNITSEPFNLFVSSNNGSVNTSLAACHVGAALESLCLSASNSTSKPNPIDAAVFQFNSSLDSKAPGPGLGIPGILTWILHAGDLNVSSSAHFDNDPVTDIALPILEPGSSRPQLLAFDTQNKLTIHGYVDYTMQPPQLSTPREFYRWYACHTYFNAYHYVNLAWKFGSGRPDDASCVAVNVTRVFV